MIADIASAILTNAIEHVSKVWVELLLAGLAAILYVTLAAKPRSSKQVKKESISSDDAVLSSPEKSDLDSIPDEELTSSQLALKAMRQGRMFDAITFIQRSPDAIRRVPFDLAVRLLTTIAKTPKLMGMANELKAFTGKISPQALDAAVMDVLSCKDLAACRQLHMLSGLLSIQKSQPTFEKLARAYASDPVALRVLVEEAGTPLARPFAELALEVCVNLKDSQLSAMILQKTASSDAVSLRSVVENMSPDRISTKSTDSLLDCFPIHSGSDVNYQKDTSNVNSTSKEVAMRANDIRSCGKNGDLKGAMKVFERLGSEASTALILNSMLDACIECNDLNQAIDYFQQPQLYELADVISYNTMMKGYLANGDESAAKRLLSELSKRGLVATRTSFHGLLNARVNAKDYNAAWKLVAEMQSAGISPNAVTCSILLKGKITSLADVSRVLALIDAMDQPMDEVLFLSVVESCIRTGRLDLLTKQTERFLSQAAASTLTAPTYGSMIKAYGHAHDVKRVWHLWDQMLFHNVQPTSVTLGCMVEALVSNGRPNEAWQLLQKMWDASSTRPLVNTVMYSSILKGFSHTKETDKVMTLYQEMRSHGIQANTITYNTIINAFAQGGVMNRVPAILEDMKAATPPVDPDIVTYSTIVKGFCNAGSLDRALQVLEDMRQSGKHAPDEVMYNSLLGGCAKEHRPDEALQLLADMRKYNVAPSNYTLSMLVKLMGRCRRINQAFTLLEDISKEYGLKINIQVYTCLIQGCFNAGQPAKALSLHEKILKEGLVPDSMTYTVLVRGCIQGRLLDKAVELVKAAYGHGPTPIKGSPPGLNAGCFDEVVAALGGSACDEAKELLSELGDIQPASTGKGGGKGYTRQPTRNTTPEWRQQMTRA